jgi:hypothetical protein
MTPDEIRIAIAEACGWWDIGSDVWGRRPPSSDRQPLPDYLNDLNAMHEAEKVLTDAQWSVFGYHLGQLVLGTCNSYDFADLASIAHATAAQRAEAFCRAKGIWRE